MPVVCARFVIIVIGAVVFGRICTAGTWYDDFSDRTSEDWGPLQFIDEEEFSIGIKNGSLNYRGEREDANLSLRNWKLEELRDFMLEMKFMFRNIEVPKESSWRFKYATDDDRSLNIKFEYSLGSIVIPNVAFVEVYRVLPGFPIFDGRAKHLGWARFEYEEGVWYRLKFEAHKNRYIFWIENFGLEVVDDSVAAGWIGFQFVGKYNICLDDFIVTGPTVPDGGPGSLRAVSASDRLTTTWGRLKARD